MRYATEESPLGTAGSVRNASAELDDTFLVISGDVLTDIDLTAFVDAHRAKRRARVDRAQAGREPARVRHRHHATRRLDRAVPREADLGSGVLRHDQHRASTCSSPTIFDLIPEGEVVDFSSDVFPAVLDEEPPPPRARRRRATGRTSAPPRRTSGRTPTCSTAGSRSRSPASSRGRRVARRGRRGRPRRPGSTARSSSATTAASRPARTSAVHRARHRRRREGRRVRSSAPSVTTTSTSAAPRACGAARSAGPPTCAATPASRRAWSSATSASSASTRSSTRASRSTRSRPSRPTRSSTRRSCGRAAARGRCSASGASAASPTSTSPPRSSVRVAMAYGTALPSGLGRHREPRHQPGRPRARSAR